MLLNILLFSLLSSYVTSQELTGDEFLYESYLDFSRTFLLKWNFNDTHILFEVKKQSYIIRLLVKKMMMNNSDIQ